MSDKTMTKRQMVTAAGLVAAFVAATASYFMLKTDHQSTPVVPGPITQFNAPAQTPQQPDSAVVDNRHHNAAVATLAMLQSYARDNAGSYPKTTTELQQAVDTYGKMIPSSTTVVYKQSYDPADMPAATDIFYYPGYICVGTGLTPTSARGVAVRYALSDSSSVCTGN